MPLPNVKKGGEEITNNTYGFEIEFCSHDNSVFAFTHVHTAFLEMPIGDTGKTALWEIETDSGNVLELVTPPLHFENIETAVKFKNLLSAALTSSVAEAGTYQEWIAGKNSALIELINKHYGNDASLDISFKFRAFAAIDPEINKENVDDGINIMAARTRLKNNENNWKPYVSATVLSRSEKDWFKSYSSQVNMPMTVEGYLFYCTSKKLIKSQQRFEIMKNGSETLSNYSTSKLERYLNTWFWCNVEFTVFVMYACRLWGRGILQQIRALVPELQQSPFDESIIREISKAGLGINKQTASEVNNLLKKLKGATPKEPDPKQLKELAVLYITVCKMLTGALGSLSEAYQLQLQQLAWDKGSTEEMFPENEPEELKAQRKWLEYHSSMKDLTSLWFKGALMDVMAKEEISLQLPGKESVIAAGWEGILGTFVSLVQVIDLDKIGINTYELQNLSFQELAKRIKVIEEAFNKKTVSWIGSPPPFSLPERTKRKFLHYGELPDSDWEGRYDTMYPAIDPHDDVGYTYLVEHRFN